jgi:hypothetical protein
MEQHKVDKVIEIAASFPLKLPQLGIESDESAFDLGEFMKQIAAR